MRLSLLVSALLVSPAHFFLAQPARPCASSRSRAPSVLRARVPIGLASEEDEGYYRALGLSDDAGYDEITDAHMRLTEQYAGDQARVDQLDEAKDKVLALMLRKRMEGSLKAEYGGQMAREDRPPVPKTPIWEIVNEFRKKTVGLPARRDALNIFGLIGGLTFATWLAPTTAGTIMLINTVSAMGFMYNRGEPDVPRDDFGQIGEIRPMKPKPMALTVAVTATGWLWGYRRAKALLLTGAVAPWVPEIVLRTTMVSFALSIFALFVKAHDIFEYPLGVPLPPKDRR